MSGNEFSPLGAVIEIKHGFAFDGRYFCDSGPYRLLTPGNFAEAGGFVDRGEKQKHYDGPVPPDFVLQPGALLVAMTEQAEGLLGSSALVPSNGKPCLHNQRLGLVRPLPGASVDVCYLYYLFNTSSVRRQIRATASGAKVRHTAPSRIAAVVAYLPDCSMQRRIATILRAYDDLIEVNRRRIAVLEEIARRLFEEWFGSRQAPRVGETGEGPWSEVTVGDVMRFVRGRSYRSTDLAESGGLPFVNLKCMLRGGGFRRDGIKRYVGEYKSEQALRQGDIVVAVTDMTQDRRIVGQAARIPRSDEPLAVMSMDLVKVLPTNEVDPVFCYFWLRFSGFADTAAQHANGANVLHLSPSGMVALPMTLPPRAIQRAFSSVAVSLADQADVLSMANERLAASRDLLLPRLIYGELPITTAERELEVFA